MLMVSISHSLLNELWYVIPFLVLVEPSCVKIFSLCSNYAGKFSLKLSILFKALYLHMNSFIRSKASYKPETISKMKMEKREFTLFTQGAPFNSISAVRGDIVTISLFNLENTRQFCVYDSWIPHPCWYPMFWSSVHPWCQGRLLSEYQQGVIQESGY